MLMAISGGNEREGGRRGDRDGFALIVALALTAFVLLVVVSLGSIGRVQSRISQVAERQALARQEALYALGLALGQLEDLAGPDRRITARADILGAGRTRPSARRWTGVWNFTGSEATLHWLVTEGADFRPDPVGGARGPAFAFFSGVSMGETVKVPLAERTGRDGAGRPFVAARHAWWTGDEGVMVSVQGVDLSGFVAAAEDGHQWLRQRAHAGVDGELLLPVGSVDPTAESWMELMHPAELEAQMAVAGRDHRSDLTLLSRGLLTNPVEGGLKVNLEDPERFVPAARFRDIFNLGRAHAVWADVPQPDRAGRIAVFPCSLQEFEELLPGEPYLHIAPVLSECAIHFAAYERQNVPSLRYVVRAEVWNPFTRPLLLNATDRRGARVVVENLPEIRFRNRATGRETAWKAIDGMPRSHFGGPLITDTWLELDTVPGGSYAGEAMLKAGEVYELEEPDRRDKPDGIWKYPGLDLGEVEADEDVVLEGRFPPTSPGVRFALHPHSHEVPGEAWGGVDGVGYRSSFSYQFGASTVPYLGRDYSTHVADSYIFAFHFALGGRWNGEDPDIAWVREADLRTPRLLQAFQGPEASRRTPPIRVAERHPVHLNNTLSGVFSGTDLLFDGWPRDSTAGAYGDVRLYDIPVGEPVTIADFRHLSFKNLPPLALGSSLPEAQELNRGFDRYFLSTVPADWVRPERGGRIVFPSSRLTLLNRGRGVLANNLRSPAAARHFELRGAFNWNSTSVRAWQAVLTDAYNDHNGWRYRSLSGEGRKLETPAAIFRDNFGAHLDQEPSVDTAFSAAGKGAADARANYFRQGVRLLSRESLAALAQSIVREIQRRGTPSASIAEFLGAGIFRRAIDDAGLNAAFPVNAKGYLLQSDLAALLSLAPAVRSDSFRILAFGEVLNEATGASEATARIEARVQRRYAFIDGRPAEEPPGARDTGALEARRFEVVSFRWIGPQ